MLNLSIIEILYQENSSFFVISTWLTLFFYFKFLFFFCGYLSAENFVDLQCCRPPKINHAVVVLETWVYLCAYIIQL